MKKVTLLVAFVAAIGFANAQSNYNKMAAALEKIYR